MAETALRRCDDSIWSTNHIRCPRSIGITSSGFQALMLVMCVSYLVVLVTVRRVPVGALVGAIVLANAILLLGPPLISQDVFGYLAFARLGALHGLDPYTHFAAEAPMDPIFRFIGWPFQNSPYGPLFRLAGCGRSRQSQSSPASARSR